MVTSLNEKRDRKEKVAAKKRGLTGAHGKDAEDSVVSPQEAEESDGNLQGFTTEDDDSSDEEDKTDFNPVDSGRLPTVSKDDAVLQAKLEKAKRHANEDRGVIYIGHLPHGFFEDELRGYFSQFGNVTRLRLSRNKKTGKSKHFAFLEFDSSCVAEIVADTMDNYLMMGHILQCKVVPKEKVHPQLWVGANRKWQTVPKARVASVKHNKKRAVEEQDRAEKRLLQRQEDRKRRLADAGIEYDLDAVGYKRRLSSRD